MHSKYFLQLLIIGMVVTGSLNTLVYKFQNTTFIDGTRFNHPYMQALCMFVGEAVCIFLYFYKMKNTKIQDNEQDLLQQKANNRTAIFALIIPAACDLVTSSLQHIALNFIPSSVYQMLRGGVIIVTAFYSKIFLGKTLEKFQKIGIFFTIIGVSIVGLSNFIFGRSDQEFSTSMQVLSIILVIVSLFFQAGIYVAEEKILKTYQIDTFLLVGMEGIWGVCMFCVLMPILNFIPCNWEEGCVHHNGSGFMERTDEFFIQFSSDIYLAIAIVLGIFSISLYNLMGVNVTKYISAVARTVIDVVRTVVIWIVGIIVTKWTDRSWENMSWKANLMEFGGYILLVFGNLIYNRMITISYFMEKQENKSQLKVQSTDYQESQ